jgi:hypothetical protein
MTRDELAARVIKADALMRPYERQFLGILFASAGVFTLAVGALQFWWPEHMLFALAILPVTVLSGTVLGVRVWLRGMQLAAEYCCPKCRLLLYSKYGERAVLTGVCPRCGVTLIKGAD